MTEVMETKIIQIQKCPDYGYELRKELTKFGGDKAIPMLSAYNLNGDYIGNAKTAYFLCRKKGIKPELAGHNGKVCCIGFCKKEQKWYGWSHRAIFGFGIGDIVKEGDCTASSGWTEECLKEHPDWNLSLPVGFEANTLDDAKRMAIAFADSVG